MARRLLGATFLVTGALHFLRPRTYEAMMPRYLPAHRELVYASGAAEMAGGAGLLAAKRGAGWWLIATLVAIFPANVEMAVHAERFRRVPEPLLWARLPVQGLLIACVWRAAFAKPRPAGSFCREQSPRGRFSRARRRR